MGYVGSVLTRHLRRQHPTAVLLGFDTGFFAHCMAGSSLFPESALDEQHFGDIRDLSERLIDRVDAIVHLAAVSNDPMGNRFQAVTEEINYKASIRLGELASVRHIKQFVFASSCSVYGSSAAGPRREQDELNPLTAYARSKIATELGLQKLNSRGMAVTCLRFATACGMSDRLRLDLVLNDFVACALSAGDITVLSDGHPWRPLIDVRDMARAIDWALSREPTNGGDFLTINVGADEWNYQVKDLAVAVAKAIPGTKVNINTAASPDRRSYRVDFTLYHELASSYLPQVTLHQSIDGLREGLTGIGFADCDFRNSQWMRLKALEAHIVAGRLLPNLRWQRANT
jgi:nucleoside-diphosphate-sugar epimerase